MGFTGLTGNTGPTGPTRTLSSSFMFAIKTSDQQIPTDPIDYFDVTFDNLLFTDGTWGFDGIATFTGSVSGIYSVSYSVTIGTLDTGNFSTSLRMVRALSTEVPGSQIGIALQSPGGSAFDSISKTIIINYTA